MTRMQNANARKGLTLLEVMVSLGILAIALTGIIAAILGSMGSQDMDRQLSLAQDAAMSQLAKARALDFEQITPTFAPPYTFTVKGLNEVPGTPVGQVFVDDTTPLCLNMRVLVTWQSQKGPRKFETACLIAK